MELIPVVSEEKRRKLVLKGFGERKWVEAQNLPHLTALLIPVFSDAENRRLVAIQIRDSRKSFPGCRDIFGGHVCLDAESWPLLLGEPYSLDGLVRAAAMREANEELRLQRGPAHEPYDVSPARLIQVGATGLARWDGPGNVERSTIYLVPVPKNCRLCPMDNVGITFFRVRMQKHTWANVRAQFRCHKQYAYLDRNLADKAGCAKNRRSWQFADGAARILVNNQLFAKVDAAIRSLPPAVFAPV